MYGVLDVQRVAGNFHISVHGLNIFVAQMVKSSLIFNLPMFLVLDFLPNAYAQLLIAGLCACLIVCVFVLMELAIFIMQLIFVFHITMLWVR